LALICGAGPALAHVALVPDEAPAGAVYSGGLEVGHGCDGSPTTALRMRLPTGVGGLELTPLPGWQVDQAPAGDTTEVTWSGGVLPDGEHTLFAFAVQLPADAVGSTLYFPVVQQCEEGVQRWIETADHADGAAVEPELPAPALMLK
jgi:uncharacterized protein YcnI